MRLDVSLPYERLIDNLVSPEREAQWRRRGLLLDAMIVRCHMRGAWDRARAAERAARRARDLHMAERLGLRGRLPRLEPARRA